MEAAARHAIQIIRQLKIQLTSLNLNRLHPNFVFWKLGIDNFYIGKSKRVKLEVNMIMGCIILNHMKKYDCFLKNFKSHEKEKLMTIMLELENVLENSHHIFLLDRFLFYFKR